MEQSESFKEKKIRNQNRENKENIQPVIDNRIRKFKSQNVNEENIEGKIFIHKFKFLNSVYNKFLLERFKLLRKKLTRDTLDENDSNISKYEFNFINSNLRKRVSESLAESKYTFTQDIKFNFNSVSRYDLRRKDETKIILTIIKSNISLPMINKTYVITERGLACSQKTHNTQYISIGRQQINDQGIRPNDIMLFPTDPSISRSHFKIFHKDYYESINLFKKKLNSMLMLTLSDKNKMFFSCSKSNTIFKYNNLNSNDVYNIMKYIAPPNKIAMEDNGTIFGTYVKVKPFTLKKFLNNFYLFLKHKPNKNINIYADNYGFAETFEIFLEFEKLEKAKSKYRKCMDLSDNQIKFIDENKFSIDEKFNAFYDYLNPLEKLSLDNFISFCEKRSYLNDYERLKENNMILKEYLPAVFLCGPKVGFIILENGGITEIINAMKIEYDNQIQFDNLNPMIELISLDKLFDCQKYDINSNIFKGSISKEEFILSLVFYPVINECSILYLIEVAGDPCGIMNRCNEFLFFVEKNCNIENKRSFSFNFIKGFLIGNNSKSCYHFNSESEAFIYYHNLQNSWMISDLTKFLNPTLYNSDDYHGLWIGVSNDKKQNNRFQSKLFYVKSGDEIKVSETVMKIQIENDQ
jgi:hypothetical protein